MGSMSRKLNLLGFCGYNVIYYYANHSSETEPQQWAPHVHDNLEIYVLVEGDVSFAVEGSVYKLAPGDAIISKPNELHNCIQNSRSVHRHLCFWFDADNDFIFEEFMCHDFGKENHIVPDSESKERLEKIYDQLIKANDDGDVHGEFHLTLEFLGILRKFLKIENDENADIPGVMNDILIDIHRNFRSIRSLEYFTSKYFLSQSTLYRMFATYLNTTPKQYLEAKKLAYSRNLLANGFTVREAAHESGFSDVSNYIRIFKRNYGETPKVYRDKAK